MNWKIDRMPIRKKTVYKVINHFRRLQWQCLFPQMMLFRKIFWRNLPRMPQWPRISFGDILWMVRSIKFLRKFSFYSEPLCKSDLGHGRSEIKVSWRSDHCIIMLNFKVEMYENLEGERLIAEGSPDRLSIQGASIIVSLQKRKKKNIDIFFFV